MPNYDAEIQATERLPDNYYKSLPRNAIVQINPSLVSGALKETNRLYVADMENVIVRAPLPETITIGMANQVGQTWEFWKVVKTALAIGSTTAGYNVNKGIGERQFWEEIEPKEVSLELSFNAFNSAKDDVYLPTQYLLKLAAASDIGNSIADLTWRRPPFIDVRIGRISKYYNCIIKSVDINYTNKLDPDGFPIAAVAAITFITRDPVGYSWLFYDSGSSGNPLNPTAVFLDGLSSSAKSAGEGVLDAYINFGLWTNHGAKVMKTTIFGKD